MQAVPGSMLPEVTGTEMRLSSGLKPKPVKVTLVRRPTDPCTTSVRG